jgi:hypothetical protein
LKRLGDGGVEDDDLHGGLLGYERPDLRCHTSRVSGGA